MTDHRWLALGLTAAACGGGSFQTRGEGEAEAEAEGEAEAEAEAEGEAEAEAEGDAVLEPACDGFDDDDDGTIDEGCACDPGATQACYPGDPADLGAGACSAGTQVCEGKSEFPRWGDCVGAIVPAGELCGNGVDDDCDGALDDGCTCALGDTTPCYPGDPGTEGVGACAPGISTCVAGGADNTWGPCTGAVLPSAEVCGNGLDEDCDGEDEPCDTCVIEVAVSGDCLWVSCPADCPYPIGCDLDFTGGDSRGCVGYSPGSSSIYLQEGDNCGSGYVSGTITCSTTPGGALTAANCPINKCNACYASGPGGCVDTGTDDPGCGCADPCDCEDSGWW